MRYHGNVKHNPNKELARGYVDKWRSVFGVEYQPDPIPERNLIAAVIRRAFLDITTCPPSKWTDDYKEEAWYERLKQPEPSSRQAVKWIENMGMDPWGYAWCSAELNLPTLTVSQIVELKCTGNELRGFARTTTMSDWHAKKRKVRLRDAREDKNG